MASLRNFAISVFRQDGQTNITAAVRHAGRDHHRPLQALGLTIVLIGLAMGIQSAVVRCLGVPDLTTTVLTLTLTGLAADSTPAGRAAPRPGRRILSVLAMFLGTLAGAVLLRHTGLAPTLWACSCSCLR
jgi:uncharacterized membrane protein YoaK (UPF0700 family)